MSKIVPLISSGTAGPLGVLHMPRLWQKVSLEAAGKIADGYPGIGAGYDSMVIDALGLNADAVRSFITDSKPTYPQFEAWVKEQPGVKLDEIQFPLSTTLSPDTFMMMRPARAFSLPMVWLTEILRMRST